jgi:hypothetical protein
MKMNSDTQKVYDYRASITWVFEFMTVNHTCLMEHENIVDIDEAESRIMTVATSFIYDYYGIDLGKYRYQDIHIDWEEFPGED